MGLGERMQDMVVLRLTEEEERALDMKRASERLAEAIRQGEEEDRREREEREGQEKS